MLDQLKKMAGITEEAVIPWTLSELLANALDKGDASQVVVSLSTQGKQFLRLSVSDNGSKKLDEAEIRLILNFDNRASTKRGFLVVSRGIIGNALKTCIGFSYALAANYRLAPPPVQIESSSNLFRARLRPEFTSGKINHDLTSMNRKDNGFTTITLYFPKPMATRRSDGKDQTSFFKKRTRGQTFFSFQKYHRRSREISSSYFDYQSGWKDLIQSSRRRRRARLFRC